MLYRFDNIEFDVDKFELRREGEIQHVEPLVFDFLIFLMKNPSRIISREEIIEEIWNGRIVSDATISSCIKSARKAIGDDGENQKYIKTIRGRGIQFLAQINTASQNSDTAPSIKNDNAKTSASIKGSINRLNLKIVSIGALLLIIVILLINQYSTTTIDINNDQGRQIANANAPYTIAVMPFVDLSADGDQEYFGDGISEEVLNVLTAVDELDVTSRTTSFSLKDQNLSVPEIADRLNVNYIVEGSVRSSGNRIRITAQLIDTTSDTHLWSENYDRELNDIFAIQDDISQQITSALKVELMGDIIRGEVPTNNMESYALYLQGHQSFLNRGMGNINSNINNLENAVSLLERSVKLDPDFAEAWADLATINLVLPTYFEDRYSFEDIVPAASAAADRAISLKPNLSEAWSVKGFILSNQFRFQEAETALNRATEINPNNETAWLWLALHFSSVADHERAIKAVERAIELEPESAIDYNVLGLIYHAMGDLEKASPLQEKSVKEMGFKLGWIDRSLLALENNNPELALSEIITFFREDEETSDPELEDKLAIYVKAYFDTSAREEALSLLEKDIAAGKPKTNFFASYMLADGEKMANYFETTQMNKIFNFRRIYYPSVRSIFAQQAFKDYIIDIGLHSYWKNNQFPTFCRAVGDDDFECN
ncbi:MAG: tetratricopeptide repeat protein [Kordiimonadaceae bacterium]|jgi:TolB-like protein/DNA-binding winged helix-turn-helix (wHTH) protein/Tfp pilus assembly protein PilF|nr:tetratricopeptide repeat protein [Kordiimonadaceae bacterium]MBT6329680.1 tetratricopeptide repeat protein [Kordiimonadaceae bacterium]